MIFIIGGAFQGKTEYAKQQFGSSYEIVDHYHLCVREQLERGADCLLEAQRLLSTDRDLVIISNEIGYGLVPMEAEERIYRETVGRVNCFLAKEAEQVIRIVCGIGTRIK